jgi:hypothetical protein
VGGALRRSSIRSAALVDPVARNKVGRRVQAASATRDSVLCPGWAGLAGSNR